MNLLPGVKRCKTSGDIINHHQQQRALEQRHRYPEVQERSGTLLYVSEDRPDTQFFIEELAAKRQVPTRGAMSSLLNLIGCMVTAKNIHMEMMGTDPSRSSDVELKG